ncbi:hypothetical protein N7537_011218 [Penicillium hordei]|uniref:SMODS and SLOG-associating 2TM effector domain-containing protein n=1 Tax=Penicillium hordei TaxID=40994 RepID=A0AAD6GTT9_9EURO|nr:uncharacterized protein N7537_011218 [Penicillium hordei]KAJ5588540.1 hypothetical protein N7537_011218 [Penicillium hordei]
MSESHQSNPQDSYDESQIYVTYEVATAHLRKKLTRKEKQLKTQYRLISIAFNLITITQVIVGAAITALGPTGGEHTLAITVLGALNTSIAGLLALLKGRGLPERLRKNMMEIAKVSDLIQERATLLRYGNNHVSDSGISLLLQEAFQAYTSAQQIIERNQTDTYANESMPQSSVVATDMDGAPSQNRRMDEEMGNVSAI